MKPKIKFCGFTSYRNVSEALDLDVDYIGFVIDYPKSPRSVDLEKFFEILNSIKRNKVQKQSKIVAVTVDMSFEKIKKLVNSNQVDVLQLHGQETVETSKNIKKYIDKKNIEIWKAFKVDKNYDQTLSNCQSYKKYVDRFLLDASSAADKTKNNYEKFSAFDIFKSLKKQGFSLILAGGLNSENINNYMNLLNPEIVDVSSQIESSPGHKDLNKMINFKNHINILKI